MGDESPNRPHSVPPVWERFPPWQVSDARNATIYCGTPVISLEWDARTDKLLMLGNEAGNIKAWNADAKRVVGDFNVGAEFPAVVDLKCSPSEVRRRAPRPAPPLYSMRE